MEKIGAALIRRSESGNAFKNAFSERKAQMKKTISTSAVSMFMLLRPGLGNHEYHNINSASNAYVYAMVSDNRKSLAVSTMAVKQSKGVTATYSIGGVTKAA